MIEAIGIVVLACILVTWLKLVARKHARMAPLVDEGPCICDRRRYERPLLEENFGPFPPGPPAGHHCHSCSCE
jgi:hypothetical protein